MKTALDKDLTHFDMKWEAERRHNPDGLFSNPDESVRRHRERITIIDTIKKAMTDTDGFGTLVQGFNKKRFIEALEFYL